MTYIEATEVVRKWRSGQTKYTLAEDFQKEQNKKIKDVDMKITKEQALQEVERAIYNEIMKWNRK